MKKITLITILIASFATKSFAHCPIPQWCPSADLHQTLCPGQEIDPIEFPSVIGRTLIINWWTDGTRFASINTPDGITVSGDASTPLGEREYAWPVSIKGAPTAIGTHHYTVSNTCGVELLHGSITLNALPTVTPTTDQTTVQNIPFASTLTLTAEPAGTPPITIQWFSNTTASNSGGTNLGIANGAQTAIFTPPSDVVNTTGVYYYAVATNSCGNTATNVSGKHIVIAACLGTPGNLSHCTGTNYVPDIGVVRWGGNGNIETQTWPISGNGISQVWSGSVTTDTCNTRKTYIENNPITDCRNATNGFDGDYFNFCFVIRYQDQLCPSPWRVPTCQDFINLDVALGGTGEDRGVGSGENGFTGTGTDQKYTGTAAGTWGGSRVTAYAGNLSYPNSIYWSSSENNDTYAAALYYNGSNVYPRNSTHLKDRGFALRCVRDVP